MSYPHRQYVRLAGEQLAGMGFTSVDRNSRLENGTDTWEPVFLGDVNSTLRDLIILGAVNRRKARKREQLKPRDD